jgi:hypothetical protein
MISHDGKKGRPHAMELKETIHTQEDAIHPLRTDMSSWIFQGSTGKKIQIQLVGSAERNNFSDFRELLKKKDSLGFFPPRRRNPIVSSKSW